VTVYCIGLENLFFSVFYESKFLIWNQVSADHIRWEWGLQVAEPGIRHLSKVQKPIICFQILDCWIPCMFSAFPSLISDHFSLEFVSSETENTSPTPPYLCGSRGFKVPCTRYWTMDLTGVCLQMHNLITWTVIINYVYDDWYIRMCGYLFGILESDNIKFCLELFEPSHILCYLSQYIPLSSISALLSCSWVKWNLNRKSDRHILVAWK